MTWEILFSITLLLLTLGSFIWEKTSSDVTAILALSVILLTTALFPNAHLPKVDDLIQVFSNPAPLTIAAMFIISSALNKSGTIDQISNFLTRFKNLGYTRVIIILVFTVGFASAFINNTPVVVMLLPVMLSLAKSMSINASKLLIPLSYASIFGGTCTLLGTSTNILASGMIEKHGFEPLGMFEITSIGVPLLICGTIYLATVGRHLLPNRETLTSILSEQERKEFITEVFVKEGSQMIGKTVRESDWYRKHGFRVMEIIRSGVALGQQSNVTPLQQGDRLVLSARPSGFAKAQHLSGLQLDTGDEIGLSTISAHEGAIVEAVLAPNSSIIGKTIEDINFRQRYRMIVLAIHRHGRNVRDRINTLKLELGDTLLLMGSEQAIENLHKGEDLILLDRPAVPGNQMRQKAPIVLSILLAIILSSSLNIMPIAAATIIGVALIFITGCLQPKEGYASIEWSLLILIYGMLAVGMTLEVTGASQMIVNSLTHSIQWAVAEPWRPMISLITIYLCTTIFTELLSNNATVVIMIPLGISVAESLGVDSRPFIIAVCIASSASFATPIGYQTNTYVYSVGGYRFSDFFKVGVPLNILYLVVSTIVIPLIWPFFPKT
jgi:di/tricarboxylate transporter